MEKLPTYTEEVQARAERVTDTHRNPHEHERAAFRGPCQCDAHRSPVRPAFRCRPLRLVLLAIALSVAGAIVLRNVTGA
jgi:hypothetical protein